MMMLSFVGIDSEAYLSNKISVLESPYFVWYGFGISDSCVSFWENLETLKKSQVLWPTLPDLRKQFFSVLLFAVFWLYKQKIMAYSCVNSSVRRS